MTAHTENRSFEIYWNTHDLLNNVWKLSKDPSQKSDHCCDVSVSTVFILTIVLQVLDVLVEKIQNSETDDIAVLLLGYEEEMLKMLRNQNPGLDNNLLKYRNCIKD